MAARAKPRRRLARDVGDLLGRDETAKGAVREPWPLRPAQDAADGGVDAVAGDQNVGFDFGAIVESGDDTVAVLPDVDAAMRQSDALGRHGFGQHRVQLAAVENHMWR